MDKPRWITPIEKVKNHPSRRRLAVINNTYKDAVSMLRPGERVVIFDMTIFPRAALIESESAFNEMWQAYVSGVSSNFQLSALPGEIFNGPEIIVS